MYVYTGTCSYQLITSIKHMHIHTSTLHVSHSHHIHSSSCVSCTALLCLLSVCYIRVLTTEPGYVINSGNVKAIEELKEEKGKEREAEIAADGKEMRRRGGTDTDRVNVREANTAHTSTQTESLTENPSVSTTPDVSTSRHTSSVLRKRSAKPLPDIFAAHRQCTVCHIEKPPRAHHCKDCGRYAFSFFLSSSSSSPVFFYFLSLFLIILSFLIDIFMRI